MVSGGPSTNTHGAGKKHVGWAVRSSGMIMYEASPSAYPSGMLVVGMKSWLRRKEETS